MCQNFNFSFPALKVCDWSFFLNFEQICLIIASVLLKNCTGQIQKSALDTMFLQRKSLDNLIHNNKSNSNFPFLSSPKI